LTELTYLHQVGLVAMRVFLAAWASIWEGHGESTLLRNTAVVTRLME
jgi:hypothetical protein